ETAERDLIGAWLLPRLRSVRSPVAPALEEAVRMIVIGVDVHKQSLTAVAVDEAGRMRDERTVAGAKDGLVAWAASVGEERLWALEDCRQLTRALERELLAAGEELVRVPPKLMAPERRAGRPRGKSDPIDALAVDRELQAAAAQTAPALLALPGCGAVSAAKLLGEIGPIERFETDAQLARHAGVAPLEASSGKQRRHRLDRGGNRQLNCALHRIAITQARVHPPARAYLERKQGEGKSRREALRCLKRQLARVVFNTLKASPALT